MLFCLIACANGEVAPFVGHNAFLRWRAIQDAAFIDKADGLEKIWSESNVSEDFDMALRLQLAGYIIRWATYSQGSFKEGVSLTVDDELNRWQKYAYGEFEMTTIIRLIGLLILEIAGCSELLFNPIAQWWKKGPIAHQIHKFLWSNAPMHYKISMMAYMFSYCTYHACSSVMEHILIEFCFRRYCRIYHYRSRQLYPAWLGVPRRWILPAQFRDLACHNGRVLRFWQPWVHLT